LIADLEQVVRQLQQHGVQFIVIGGWAAIIHGTARSTNDVDVVWLGEFQAPFLGEATFLPHLHALTVPRHRLSRVDQSKLKRSIAVLLLLERIRQIF